MEIQAGFDHFACGEGDFSLPKLVRSAILISKLPGIGRMPDYCRCDAAGRLTGSTYIKDGFYKGRLWMIKMKALIKKALWTLGYELHPRAFAHPDASMLRDEVIEGPWTGNTLQVSNRYYRPPVLRYHRTAFGDDTRSKYITEFLDVRDQRILELGAHEGYHSILLEKMGVRENIAIESRPQNLRKCQRIKEKYHLDHTTFVQGDLERLYGGEDLASLNGPFDLVFCLGVLYHLPEPGRGLEWMRSQSSTLFLGTHYCEGPSTQNDVTYTYHGKSYRTRKVQESGIDDPLSGMSPTSLQLYEYDLLRLIHDVGYSQVSVLGKDVANRTPHITLLAEA